MDYETSVSEPFFTNDVPSQSDKKSPRFIVDLFAGCGGLSLGFEHAGFRPAFVNELNDDARATYLANRSEMLGGKPFCEHDELISADVHELDENRLTELKAYLESLNVGLSFGERSTLDIVAGGPPCQGYSGIGHRRSYSVDKEDIPSNRLYERMAFVIEQTKPRIFLFENVKGLLSARWTADGRKGDIWAEVYGRFKRLGREFGYEVRWKLVYAKDYGVPQNRPRVLIVGVRSDIAKALGSQIDLLADPDDAVACGLLPHCGERAPNLIEVLGDLEDKQISRRLKHQDFEGGLSTLCYTKPAVGYWQNYFRPGRLASVLAPLSEQDYSQHSLRIVQKFQAMIESNGEIPEKFRTKKFAQRLLPKEWGNRGPSITACCLADDYVHFSQPRSLTVREWARLQTFPDTYVFRGKRTTGGLRRAGNPREGNFDREVPKYTQIGNAVPVKLAEAVAKHFRRLLDAAGC